MLHAQSGFFFGQTSVQNRVFLAHISPRLQAHCGVLGPMLRDTGKNVTVSESLHTDFVRYFPAPPGSFESRALFA